jgi:hypothetical protein
MAVLGAALVRSTFDKFDQARSLATQKSEPAGSEETGS